jgi:hypothetical protein
MTAKQAAVLLVLVALCGCEARSRPVNDWPVDCVLLQNPRIEVRSGTSFDCFGRRCCLLGVKDSPDADKRKQAEQFTREWFEEQQGVFVLNCKRPLERDGVCVCWITAAFGVYPFLNRDLVRAGLVDVDLSKDEAYTFDVVMKEGPDRPYVWQGKLRDARQEFERAAKK